MIQVGREENQAFLPAPLPFLQQLHGGGSSCPLGTGDAYRVAGGRGVYRQNGKNPPWETYTWVKSLWISVICKRNLRFANSGGNRYSARNCSGTAKRLVPFETRGYLLQLLQKRKSSSMSATIWFRFSKSGPGFFSSISPSVSRQMLTFHLQVAFSGVFPVPKEP